MVTTYPWVLPSTATGRAPAEVSSPPHEAHSRLHSSGSVTVAWAPSQRHQIDERDGIGQTHRVC